jgi:hypothetical protein
LLGERNRLANLEFLLDESGTVHLENIDCSFSFLLCQSLMKRLWKRHLRSVHTSLCPGGTYTFQFAWNPQLSSEDSIAAGASGSIVYQKEEMARLVNEAGYENVEISPPIQVPESDGTVWFFCKATKEK